MRLTGAIPKQSNSTVQIRPPPWLNLLRKPELDLLPLELDFLYGWDLHCDRLPCKSSRRKRVSFEAQQSTVYAASLRWGVGAVIERGFGPKRNLTSVEGEKRRWWPDGETLSRDR